MPTVYIETSIVSYLRSPPNSSVVMAARQVLTHRWWTDQRPLYDLVTSHYVIDEASAGNPALAAERLRFLDGIRLLTVPAEVGEIAEEIMRRSILPPKASTDALHIALVAYHEIEYLLTWNCRHIANARLQPRIFQVLAEMGYSPPIICTPQELIEYGSEDEDEENEGDE